MTKKTSPSPNFFTHPTKRGLIVAVLILAFGCLCTIAAATDLFTQRYRSSPATALMIPAVLAVVKMYGNYRTNSSNDPVSKTEDPD